MKSFLQHLQESTPPDPYDWDTNYGKRFKWVQTPSEAQNPPQKAPTVSLVTPANRDAWNWPEVPQEQLVGFQKNWPEIQKGIAPHKRIQIETGQNVSADDIKNRGSAGPAGMTPDLSGLL